MKNINADWHKKNLMPKNPTLEQRIRWYREHIKHCGCAPIPRKLAEEMEKKKTN